MLGELGRDTKGSIEGIKVNICENTKWGEHFRRLYLFYVSKDRKYYVVFDPGYNHGHIHVYEHKESIPIDAIEEKYSSPSTSSEYSEGRKRNELVLKFIKDRFDVESGSIMGEVVAGYCEEYEVPKDTYMMIKHILENESRKKEINL